MKIKDIIYAGGCGIAFGAGYFMLLVMFSGGVLLPEWWRMFMNNVLPFTIISFGLGMCVAGFIAAKINSKQLKGKFGRYTLDSKGQLQKK